MTLFLSMRYAFSKTGNHLSRTVRIVIMIAISITALSLVMSIMSALQRDRIVEAREVRSFDAIFDGERVEELSERYPHARVFPYAEGEALINGEAYLVRYIDERYDGGIRLLSGNASELLVPLSFPKRNGEVTIVRLMEGRSGISIPRTEARHVSGVYASPLGSEFDSLYIFMPLDDAPSTVVIKTGVKGLSDKEIKALSEESDGVMTWKESERALYSALLIEKTLVYAVLFLLFIVIGVSLRGSIRDFWRQKRRERGVIKILGLSRGRELWSLMLSFIIITLIGLIGGLVLSLSLIGVFSSARLTYYFGTYNISMPWMSYFIFSLLMLFFVVVFTLIEWSRASHHTMLEAIYER